MTTQQRLARTRLSLLELASQLANVSKACKALGYPRALAAADGAVQGEGDFRYGKRSGHQLGLEPYP